jgi:P27 family predicted phage terminase small subunit
VPELPSHLSAEAVLEWHRITKELLALKILTKVDRAALAAYCQAWGRWVDAEDHLRLEPMIFKSPSGYPVLSPWWSVANKSMEQMRNFLTEFGLSPASRTRIKGSAAPSDEKPLGARRFLA